MDRIVITGQDGKPKYELTEANDIIEICRCTSPGRPYEITGNKKMCLLCDKEIK